MGCVWELGELTPTISQRLPAEQKSNISFHVKHAIILKQDFIFQLHPSKEKKKKESNTGDNVPKGQLLVFIVKAEFEVTKNKSQSMFDNVSRIKAEHVYFLLCRPNTCPQHLDHADPDPSL